VVVRPPEVFVRPLAHEEAVALKRRAKQAKHFATRERAAILLASNVGTPVPQIAQMWMTDESHVRRVIHDFNERGMASLDPEYRGGRPRRITREQRRAAVAVAGARPDHQGVALTRWSLPRLADHLRASGMLEISPAHLGRLLAQAGLSFQRTRTWKASPDPDYAPKAARVLELTSAPPADGGVVIAFDQMGPISLRPTAGAGWAPQGRPERQRATYHRPHGTRYIFGAYDVHQIVCGSGSDHDGAAATTSPSWPSSVARSPNADASTGSRTASAPTGPQTSAPLPMATTSSSFPRRPTRAT
jgi:transposase